MTRKKLWLGFLPIMLSAVMITLLLTTGGALSPLITETFGLTSQQAPWMNILYTMSAAILAPLLGWYGDKHGMKKQLIIGIGTFILSDLLSSFSPSYVIFCGARFLAGFGLAAAYPAALSFISNRFPDEQKVGAFAILGACINLGSGSGPTVAGLLLNVFQWRQVYLISAAVMTTLLAFVLLSLPKEEPRQGGPRKLDGKGMATLFVGIGAVLTLLTLSTVYGWTSWQIISLLGVGAIALTIFVRHENQTEAPLMDLSLLKNPGFVVPALAGLFLYGIKAYCSVSIPYYFILGLGLSSTISGLWLTTFFAAGFPISFFVGKLNSRFTTRAMAVFSVITWLACIGVFCISGAEPSMALLFGAAVVASIGVAIMVGIANSSALKVVPPEKSGAASGTISLISNLGSSMFSALIIPYLGVIGRMADGSPDYLVSFPAVGKIMLIPIGLCLVLAFLFPKDKNA